MYVNLIIRKEKKNILGRRGVIFGGFAEKLNYFMDIWSKGKVSKGAKISNRYNQVPQLTQDTNGKVTN